MFACCEGKSGELNNQASKMYSPPDEANLTSYEVPPNQSECWKVFVYLALKLY